MEVGMEHEQVLEDKAINVKGETTGILLVIQGKTATSCMDIQVIGGTRKRETTIIQGEYQTNHFTMAKAELVVNMDTQLLVTTTVRHQLITSLVLKQRTHVWLSNPVGREVKTLTMLLWQRGKDSQRKNTSRL